MPANVAKSKSDEAKWDQAKEIAAKEGKSNKWPLIMHIYNNMKEDKYSGLVNSIVEAILETTSTGAVAAMETGLGSPIDGKKVVDAAENPAGDQVLPVQTLAMLNPDVFLPLSQTTKTNHVVPKGDQTGGYDHKNRPDQIIKSQEDQVKTGIISLILRAGVERAKAETEAKAQEKAQEIAAKKEEARFELSHGGKVLDQKQKEWELEKEKLLFKAKHKPKVK